MRDKRITETILREYQQEAEELGISLQEYLLFLMLEKLEDIELHTGSII